MSTDARAPSRRRARRNLAAGLPSLLACGGLVALWEALARFGQVGGVPPVADTLRAMPDILLDPDALNDIGASLRRMATGYAVSVAIAVPLGLLMGRSRAMAALLAPLLALAYPIPKAALMPLVMLWLGVGDAAKLLVIVLATSMPILFHAFQGARTVDEKMLWSAAAMGMRAPARLARVVAPAALPETLVGCRTGLVLALITMITSEMIARQSGAGNILFGALDMAQYETVYAMILVIGAIAVGVDVLFEAVRRMLTGWADPDGSLGVLAA